MDFTQLFDGSFGDAADLSCPPLGDGKKYSRSGYNTLHLHVILPQDRGNRWMDGHIPLLFAFRLPDADDALIQIDVALQGALPRLSVSPCCTVP